MMLSSTPLAMDENSTAASTRSGTKQAAAGLSDEAPRKGLGGAAKPKTRRALGDLSSSQVNSRLQVAATAGKPLKIAAASKKDTFQVLDTSSTAAIPRTAKPFNSGEYYDEADFVCSRGVQGPPKDPSDVVIGMSKRNTYTVDRSSGLSSAARRPSPLPAFPDSSFSDDILSLVESSEAQQPPIDFNLDAFDENW